MYMTLYVYAEYNVLPTSVTRPRSVGKCGKFSVLGAALKTYQRKGEGGERGERKGEKKERKEKKKREDSKCIDFADE